MSDILRDLKMVERAKKQPQRGNFMSSDRDSIYSDLREIHGLCLMNMQPQAAPALYAFLRRNGITNTDVYMMVREMMSICTNVS